MTVNPRRPGRLILGHWSLRLRRRSATAPPPVPLQRRAGRPRVCRSRASAPPQRTSPQRKPSRPGPRSGRRTSSPRRAGAAASREPTTEDRAVPRQDALRRRLRGRPRRLGRLGHRGPFGAEAHQQAPAPGPRRTKFILAHQWKADDKTEFLAGVKSAVEGTWSNQYEFHINKPDWTWIGARVNVDTEVREKAGAKAAGDDLVINSVEVPSGEDINDFGADCDRPGIGRHPHDQSMLVGSTDIKPREDNLLRKSVFFANNSADLTSGAKSTIKDFATTFNGAAAGTPGSRPADVHTRRTHRRPDGRVQHAPRAAARRRPAHRTDEPGLPEHHDPRRGRHRGRGRRDRRRRAPSGGWI